MDDLLDLFDRDSRQRRDARRPSRGLRTLLDRFTDDDEYPDRRGRSRDDDDLPRRRRREQRRRRDDMDLFDF